MALLVLTSAQATVVADALAEAEQYRRDTAKRWCAACAATPSDGGCPAHLGFVGHADAYRRLRHSLAALVPGPDENDRTRRCERRDRPSASATP